MIHKMVIRTVFYPSLPAFKIVRIDHISIFIYYASTYDLIPSVEIDIDTHQRAVGLSKISFIYPTIESAYGIVRICILFHPPYFLAVFEIDGNDCAVEVIFTCSDIVTVYCLYNCIPVSRASEIYNNHMSNYLRAVHSN